MNVHRTLSAFCVILPFVAVSGCQRGNINAQAAREERGLNPNGENPGKMAPQAGMNTLSAADRDVVYKLESANLEEVGLASYIKQRSKNGAVQNLANMMIEDHSKALSQIRNLLKEKGINQPTETTPEDELSGITALRNSSRTDIDRDYINLVVEHHQRDLNELRAAEASVQDPDLKNYIHNLIPIIENQLRQAESLNAR